MELRRITRLRFTLSDAELNAVVDMLAAGNPFAFHRRAWETLMTEVERRQDGRPAEDVRLWSGVYDTLPTPVQRMLSEHVSVDH